MMRVHRTKRRSVRTSRRFTAARVRFAASSGAILLFTASVTPSWAQQATGGAELPDAPLPQSSTAQADAKTGHAMISGVVSDIRGGLVSGATITLTLRGRDVATGISAADGSFHFLALEAGTYSVVIASPGLETFLSPAIALKTDERFELPDVALPIASASETVNVVMTQAQVADEELKAETQQRVFGVFPNFYTSFLWNAAPLNPKQKLKLSLRTITDPVAFAGSAVVAGIETGRNTFPEWGQGADGYGKRIAAAYGDQVFGRLIGSALYPSLFRQDPRYFFMGPNHPMRERLKHALLNGIEARGDNGKWQPNYSHILGNASAGALSTVYHPASNSPQKLAGLNALVGVLGGSVQGLVREFVTSRVTHKVPPYANGKPVDRAVAATVAPPAPSEPSSVPASGTTAPAKP